MDRYQLDADIERVLGKDLHVALRQLACKAANSTEVGNASQQLKGHEVAGWNARQVKNTSGMRTEALDNVVELIDVALSGEKRQTCQNLGEHAPCADHQNGSSELARIGAPRQEEGGTQANHSLSHTRIASAQNSDDSIVDRSSGAGVSKGSLTCGPHVHGLSVVSVAHEKLGAAVPPRRNIVLNQQQG